jgi:hypothetical protein
MGREIASWDDVRKEKELSRRMEGLDVRQCNALQILMNGGRITSAAVAADVSRQTIHSWMGAGHPFRVALDLWKKDVAQCARTRLVMMTDLATSNVAVALKRGDTQTAMRLLEKLGVLAPPPVGPTEQEVRRDKEHAKARMEKAKADTTADGLAEVGLWKDEFEDGFSGGGMGFDSAGGLRAGGVGEADGGRAIGRVGGSEGRGDLSWLRDEPGRDGDSAAVHLEESGEAEDSAAQDAGAAGDEGE